MRERKCVNGVPGPIEQRAQFQEIALIDGDKVGALPMSGLVRAQPDNPGRRSVERAIERLHFADMAASGARFARLVKAVDSEFIDQSFEGVMPGIDRPDPPPIPLLGRGPKLVRLGKQTAGIKRCNLDIDCLLGQKVEDDLILQSEAGGERDLPADRVAKARQSLPRR